MKTFNFYIKRTHRSAFEPLSIEADDSGDAVNKLPAGLVYWNFRILLLLLILVVVPNNSYGQAKPKTATLLPAVKQGAELAPRAKVAEEIECDFTIKIRGESGREEDSVQDLVDYLERCGCDPVRWTHQNPSRQPSGAVNDDAWWTITGSFVQKDLPIVATPKLMERDEVEVSNAISTGGKFPHGAHKVSIFDADDLNTGLIDRLLGPWYRPHGCRVTSSSVDGLCVLLGCEPKSLEKLDAQTKTRIASALCIYHKSGGGDLFAGGNTRSKLKR